MTSNAIQSSHSRLLIAPLVALLLVIVFIGAAYSLAWTGSLHFDDRTNLNRLGSIDDRLDAADFIVQGASGPLGRPLALATFAAQASAWPEPRPFLMVNTYIHLLNVLLVFWLAFLLARIANGSSRCNAWFAVAVAACWGSSPFLASASLMIVQRMATLSAVFVFLGLIGYLYGRIRMTRSPRRGLALALSSLGLGTGLAVLTKENGALLPVFALVCELTLIRTARARVAPLPNWVLFGVLVLPLAAIVGFLIYRGFGGSGFLHRDFTLSERMLTQPRAIWDYVFNMLLPRASTSTPYTDTFTVSRGILEPLTTLVAILSLVSAVSLAWIGRRGWWFLTFGASFFLAGHLLESTSLPLEIYFPHRNYVPSFGLFFGLFFLLTSAVKSPKTATYTGVGVALYVLISLFVLVSATSLWGQPDLARHIWYLENPDSIRARQDRIGLHISQGNAEAALALISETLERQPNNPTLALQSLIFCTEDDLSREGRIQTAKAALAADRPIPFSAAEQLAQLARTTPEHDCNKIRAAHLQSMLDLGFENLERYPNAGIRQTLLFAQAQLHATNQEYSAFRSVLREALISEFRVEVVRLIAQSYSEEERHAEARETLEQAMEKLDGSPIRRAIDRARLKKWIAELREAE